MEAKALNTLAKLLRGTLLDDMITARRKTKQRRQVSTQTSERGTRCPSYRRRRFA